MTASSPGHKRDPVSLGRDVVPDIRLRRTVVVFAALTVVLVGAGATYLDFKTNSGRLAMSNLPVVVLIPFVFWLLTNLLLKVCTPRLSLSTGELRFVLSLLWTGGMFAGFNWITRWIGGMTAPRYYASPENRWEDLIFDYIPWWLYPTDAPGVVGRFYLGLGREALPWGAWIPPVFWAISAAVAMTAIGLGLTALFQRQWIQHERLTYPLAQASLDLTRGFDRRAGLPKLFRTRLFWVGFAAAALPLLFNLIEYWNPGFPHVSIFDPYYSRWSGHRGIQVSRFLFPISYRILPTLTGFLFLCDVNILFSIWSLFAVGQTLLHGMYRIGLSAGLSGQSASPGELGNIFSHGAMMGLSVWTVWTARGHLKRVFRQVLRPESASNVSVFVPRPAFIALIGGLIYLVFWLHAVGFGWLAALAWLVFFWAGMLTAMKFLAASGYAYLFPYWGLSIDGVTQIWIGSVNMAESTQVGLRLINEGSLAGWRLMPVLPQISRLRTHGIARLVFAGTLIGLLSAALYTIWFSYTQGAAAFQTWTLRGQPVNMYQGIANAVSDTHLTVPDPAKIAVWLIGGATVTLMIVLQVRLAWWPIHPAGFWLMFEWYVRYYSVNIFLVWLAKVIVLKFGGILLYRRLKPCCYGLIAGYAFALGCSLLVDLIWFPGGGHFIHAW